MMMTFDSYSKSSGAQEKPASRHMSKGNVLLAMVGVVLLAWVVVHAGPSAVVHQDRKSTRLNSSH